MKKSSSLSDLKNRSENSAGRGQILPVLQVNSRSIDQKSGEIWIGQADLQPISFKFRQAARVGKNGQVGWELRCTWPTPIQSVAPSDGLPGREASLKLCLESLAP